MIDNGTRASSPDDDENESTEMDLARMRELAGFVLRSLRRRALLALTTFSLVSGLGLVIASALPQMYNSQVKLLAQRSSAIRVLSSLNPAMESVDKPLQNIAAIITRHDNLVALVRESGLVDRFQLGRPALLRYKDRLRERVFGPVSLADREAGLVATLESRLAVEVQPDDATVIFSVDWPGAQLAYDLVTLMQKKFLEARYDGDVAMITDSISVLEEHAKNELSHVDAEIANYQKTLTTTLGRPSSGSPSPGAPSRAASQAKSPGPRVAPAPGSATTQLPDLALVKALEDKRSAISKLEEARARSLEAANQQLSQYRLTLAPMHPTVVAAEQQIAALSQPSAELQGLKAEERALISELALPRASELALPRAMTPPAATSRLPLVTPFPVASAAEPGSPPSPLAPTLSMLDRDGQLQLAGSTLSAAIRSYGDASARIDAAKIELDITRTAFKHRYTVLSPAEVPRAPKKATAAAVRIGSIIGGLILATLLAAGMDLSRGVVVEAWQIRRQLKLDVIAELDS